MSLAVQKPDQAGLAYVSLAITMERKTSLLQSSLMPCARSARRPYRALLQNSRSVSTCRFMESWLVIVMPRALMLVTRWMFAKVGGSVLDVPRLPRALKIIRPPGTLVPEGLMFYPWCFLPLFYSQGYLRAPLADHRETLPHDRNMGVLCNASPKIRGPSPQRNWGPKTCKIWCDFRQLQTSIVNISGTGQDIENRKTYFSRSIPPACQEKSLDYDSFHCSG